MQLFDDFAKRDTLPASYSEAKFEYLNRSGRPAFHKIRAVLEEWFSRHPEPHRSDLCARFRSREDINHQSAFFELFLHELLLCLGHTLEVHPAVAGTKKRLDFRVTTPKGASFYVEAVVSTGRSSQEMAARALKNIVHDALNRLRTPNFFVEWEVTSRGRSVPSASRIRSFLIKKLASLDPDEVTSAIRTGGFDQRPRWVWSNNGWAMEFSVVPKSQGLRNKPGVRPVGLEMEGGGYVDDRTPLRDTILKKAGKYGKLDSPFVVAVNSLADHLDRTDVLEALFGREEYVYRQTPRGIEGPGCQRAPDGVWTSRRGPRYTRLSAVLLFHYLLPWSIREPAACLYFNPFAEKSLDSNLCRLPKMMVKDGRAQWLPGKPLESLLALPDGWPGPD